MTERLYFRDSYLTEFRARLVEAGDAGRRVYLDRTAFYPTSGGQPFDLGRLGSSQVVDVVEEGERIAHILDAPLSGEEVDCRIDWTRRFDHMQQHTGQHLLSAVLLELFDHRTVGFHLGEESSTIDIDAPSLELGQVREAERRVNRLVVENRPVRLLFADSSQDLGLRKASQREGELRVVEIEGIDRSACGGTHVRSTGEIGLVQIRKLDKIRGNVRIEFLCGLRAAARARADYEALSQIGRSLSAPLDETPALVATELERWNDAEKARKKLAAELARFHGQERYDATPPGEDGFRRILRRVPKGAIDDELRILAQGFAVRSRAVFIAVVEEPPSVLLCVSADAGIHAGNVLRAALVALGGRGGGNAQLAQGSVASREALAAVQSAIG